MLKVIFLKKPNIYSLIFLIYWLSLWLSINTRPPEIFNFGKDLMQSINSLRLILPLFFSILISIYLLCILCFKKFKIRKIHLFFFFFFFAQLTGLLLRDPKNFNIHYIYLEVLAIGTICLFALCDYYKLDRLYKYFFFVSLLCLFIAFNFSLWPKLTSVTYLNFYNAFSEKNLNIFNQSSIRITGLSRMLAIINLFLILYLYNLKSFYLKKILQLLITIGSLLLLFMQSRGTLVCYFASIMFIIFFKTNNEGNHILKNILILIIVPIFLYFSINNILYESIKEKEGIKIDSRILQTHSSGRTYIWSYTLRNYEYKKIFGYGPHGDRFFLENLNKKNPFGDNASNIFIYSLLSGGFASLLLMILIFFNIFLIIKKFIESNSKNFYVNSLFENFAIICLIFFSIRSIFENSFGLFSVDFLITFLSLSYLVNLKKKFIQHFK